MKFFCEYCGNRIDAEVDHKCPNCGASYRKNKKFMKLEEEKNKEKQINNEYKHKVINHVLGTMKFSRFFMLIPIIVFIIIFTIVIITFSNARKGIKEEDSSLNVEDIFDTVLGEDSKEQEKVTVDFNEFGETLEYKVKVEKYEVVEDKFNEAEDGYELVKFHLIVENLTDNQIYKEDVNCIVNGIAQKNDFTSGYSDLPMFISRELTVKGTATFIVPKDATSYDIRYGDYVTIHIEK